MAYTFFVTSTLLDIALALYASMNCYSDGSYRNDYDGYHNNVQSAYFMNGVESSVHANYNEDRKWKWRYCRQENPAFIYSMAMTATGFDSTWYQDCDTLSSEYQAASIGGSSTHSNNAEDRIWIWHCGWLNKAKYRLADCFDTGYLNTWDQTFTYYCPNNGVIRKIYSEHSNNAEDRRYGFVCCNIEWIPCFPQNACNDGYMDKTNGNSNYWGCGENCPGGAYLVDGSCNCACVEDSTCSPTYSPTPAPTDKPTRSPAPLPTYSPTPSPTDTPTRSPTTLPTHVPTSSPTHSPTPSPTLVPTPDPTFPPTFNPSNVPTPAPTFNPTHHPTEDPTIDPTIDPTKDPIVDPTKDPSIDPTNDPTNDPTSDPSKDPTIYPTKDPSIDPTNDPTNDPTADPSKDPTIYPTKYPTIAPTISTSLTPTEASTYIPSTAPTYIPTPHPIHDPTTDPTLSPTFCLKGKYLERMKTGDYLWSGESFVSYNCLCQLKLKGDGNLVLYGQMYMTEEPFKGWDTNTTILNRSGESVAKFEVKTDGLILKEYQYKNVPSIPPNTLWFLKRNTTDIVLYLSGHCCLQLLDNVLNHIVWSVCAHQTLITSSPTKTVKKTKENKEHEVQNTHKTNDLIISMVLVLISSFLLIVAVIVVVWRRFALENAKLWKKAKSLSLKTMELDDSDAEQTTEDILSWINETHDGMEEGDICVDRERNTDITNIMRISDDAIELQALSDYQ